MLAGAVIGGLEAMARSIVFLGFVAFAAWLVLWRPSLHIHDSGVTAHNVTRSIEVPWGSLVNVETKYALTLVTPEARYAVWVAPAPGAIASRRVGRELRKKSKKSDPLTAHPGMLPGDLPGTDSGDAARIIRDELERRADAGTLAGGAAGSTLVHWNVVLAGVAFIMFAVGLTAAII